MPGINSGILYNAQPLNAEQIKELERRVIEERQTFVYLNEQGQLCFASPFGARGLEELAWNTAYELYASDNSFIKNVYKKQSLQSFYLAETLQKDSLESDWPSTFSLLDEGLLDNFILE